MTFVSANNTGGGKQISPFIFFTALHKLKMNSKAINILFCVSRKKVIQLSYDTIYEGNHSYKVS